MNELMVAAADVYKTYDTGTVSVRALRGVSLEVKSGEMVAIMGPSGCGKTTMLNCLSGLDEVDSGQVLIDGVALHQLPDDERSDYRARNMGFVFQLYNLLPVLRAVENVEMPLLVSGVGASEARRRALEVLDLMGLTERAHHVPGRAFRRGEAAGDYRPGPGKRAGHRMGRRTHRGPGQRDGG